MRRVVAVLVAVGLAWSGLPLRAAADPIPPLGAATVGGAIWNDLDGDETHDEDEPVLPGVVVELLGDGADDEFGTADDAVFPSTTTNGFGDYVFALVPADRYRVTPTPPVGFSPTTDVPVVLTVAAAEVRTDVDFGVWQTDASISGRIVDDDNGNAALDGAETGLDDVTVTLQQGNQTIGTATSDTDGEYTFTDLPRGTYTVEAATPVDFAATTSTTASITIAVGEAGSVPDIAFRQTNASIGDLVYEDDDGDGMKDTGEPGLAGVVVTLAQGGSTLENATTAAGGSYVFDQLPSGNYDVSITTPTSFAATTAASTTVALSRGQAYVAADFGVRNTSASIGDLVFDDRNENGTIDPGESGIGGVTVTLRQNAVVVATTTTNGAGEYVFASLLAGAYVVEASVPAPRLATTETSFTVTLAKGESFVAADFGFSYKPATTVVIDQAGVTTFAGNGTSANIDGVGTNASFAEMGAMVVHRGFAYQATRGAIRKVNLATGAVTTLTGGGQGCTPSSNPANVRLTTVTALVTDGAYLYGMDTGCASNLGIVLKVSIATGATTHLTSLSGGRSLTYGPDGFLYLITISSTLRLNPNTGASTTFAPAGGYSIASDADALWVTSIVSCLSPCSTEVKRISLTDASVTTLTASREVGGDSQLVSAGAYLYNTAYGRRSIVRFSKADGTWTRIAGTNVAGYADGTGTEAWFSDVQGLASDGAGLWAADHGNRRLRRLAVGTPLPHAQPGTATTTLAINPAAVTTFAGNGADANIDGTGSAASFNAMGASTVVAGFLYQATSGRIRRVSLGTREVTTFSGGGLAGCVEHQDPAQVRFGMFTGLDSDGTYLYGADATQCSTTSSSQTGAVWRISLATGAASVVARLTGIRSVTVGPDGYLYASTLGGTYRIHRVNGTAAVFASAGGYGIAADDTYLWANQLTSCHNPCKTVLKRVRISDASVTTMTLSQNVPGDTQLVSAGDYLYATGYGRKSVVRFTKATGVGATIAGPGTAGTIPNGGYADAVGINAYFAEIQGLAVHNGTVYIADSGNRRLRRAVQAKQAIDPGGPTARERLGGSCACAQLESDGGPVADPVDPSTGNFYDTAVDLSVPGRGPALAFGRTYNSLAAAEDSPLGYGWTHSYAMTLPDDPYLGSDVKVVKQGNASEMSFARTGSTWMPPARVLATLVENGDGTWTYTRRGGARFVFDSARRLVRQVDRNGYATIFSYDGSGRLSTVTDPSGRAMTVTYGTNGRILRVTDHAARQVSYTYDAAGNLTDVTDVGGGNTHFTYDAGHLLLTVRDPRGNVVVTNAYDAARRVVSQADGRNRSTTFAYGEDGVVSITSPSGSVTRRVHDDGMLVSETRGYGTPQAATWNYEHDPVTLGVTATTDPNGNTRARVYDARGNVVEETDALGRTTTVAYNALDKPVTITNAKGVTTTYTYDANGNLTSVATPLVGTGQIRTTSYAYDPTRPGDVVTITDVRGSTWSRSYDVRGNFIRAEDPLGNVTTMAYDTLGRQISTTTPKGNAPGATPADHTSTYAYNAFGDLLASTNALGETVTRAYDANRNLLSVSDAEGATTTHAYNAANELTATTRADGSVVEYEYDADGRPTVRRDAAGRVTTYGYDALGRTVSVTDPLQRTETTTYDGVGNPKTITNAASKVTTFSYDDADRVIGVDYSDASTPDASYAYDELGRRTSMTDGTGTTTYEWDSLSRLVASTDGSGATVGYEFDLAGSPTHVTYPHGGVVERAYDSAGRLASVTDWGNRTTSFAYDRNGNITTKSLPNGVTEVYTHDRTDLLGAVEHRLGGAAFASFSYTRDGNGHVTGMTPTGVGQAPEAYTYTPLHQLASLNGDAYTYDLSDNVTRLATGAVLAYDAAGQVTSMTVGTDVTTFGHDVLGNRTSVTPPTGSPTTMAYDQANRLTAYGSGASYAYNGDGLRVAKTLSGVTEQFAWDLAGPVPRLLRDGAASYVYGPDGTPIAQVAPDGSALFFHADQLGSVRVVTDETGSVVRTASFDPYGRQTGSSGAATVSFGFAGEYRDAESGFVYLRARYYDPTSAQFISRDPLVAMTDAPYLYADGNPLNGVDPTGLAAQPRRSGSPQGGGGEMGAAYRVWLQSLCEAETRRAAAAEAARRAEWLTGRGLPAEWDTWSVARKKAHVWETDARFIPIQDPTTALAIAEDIAKAVQTVDACLSGAQVGATVGTAAGYRFGQNGVVVGTAAGAAAGCAVNVYVDLQGENSGLEDTYRHY